MEGKERKIIWTLMAVDSIRIELNDSLQIKGIRSSFTNSLRYSCNLSHWHLSRGEYQTPTMFARVSLLNEPRLNYHLVLINLSRSSWNGVNRWRTT